MKIAKLSALALILAAGAAHAGPSYKLAHSVSEGWYMLADKIDAIADKSNEYQVTNNAVASDDLRCAAKMLELITPTSTDANDVFVWTVAWNEEREVMSFISHKMVAAGIEKDDYSKVQRAEFKDLYSSFTMYNAAAMSAKRGIVNDWLKNGDGTTMHTIKKAAK